MAEPKVISRLERMKSSVNGNPRFMVTFTDGSSMPTKPDAMLAYGIENEEYRDRPLLVEVERGQIVYLRNADGSRIDV